MGDENKIYVGGLAAETTSDGLRAHFAKFGEITDCIVMPDKVTGRSRCFGFITFKDMGAMNAALGTANLVDGREVACKKAVRENPALSGQGVDGPYNTLKIFVGGLPASCDYDKFTSYFGRFGQIEDAVVMMDNQTQRHRGFGYVTFSDSSAVEATLQNYAANQIDGKWIEVKRCIPQDKMAPGQSFKGKGKAAGKGAANGRAAAPPPSAAPGPPPAASCPGYGAPPAYGAPPYGVAYGAPAAAPPPGGAEPFRDYAAGGGAYAGAYGGGGYGGPYGGGGYGGPYGGGAYGGGAYVGYGGGYGGAYSGAYGPPPGGPYMGPPGPRYGYRPAPY